ncbi:uroporphyrinogen decarboxylase family protein [Candidatus Hydrogenedentota bacterium]
MTDRENTIRAARFQSPERIPISFGVGSGCWDHYPQDALQELMSEHPLLFPDFQKTGENILPKHAPWRRAGAPYTDSWGCMWETAENGITGAVVKHALADWAAFSTYVPPSPDEHNGWGAINWSEIRKNMATAREQGRLVAGGLRHGHTFLTMTYLRGYENLIFDMCDGHPQLQGLIAMVEDFNLGLVRRYIEAGVEWMGYPEDLGMQRGPLLSPELFRQYIKPAYQRLVTPAREAGCVIHMHSDGDIRTLAEDLIEIGVDVINLQDFVNGIDWMQEMLRRRVCIDLDIDRQGITRFGLPREIHNHIAEAVRKLGSRKGGLMLKYGLVPGAPLENIKAVMNAMEKYSQYYS